MDEAKGFSVFLENAKPSRAIRRVGGLVDSGVDLLLDDLTDLLVETWGNRDVTLDPRLVVDDCEFDGGEEVWSESSLLLVIPSESSVVLAHQLVDESEFWGSEEFGTMLFVEFRASFGSVASCRSERGWIERQSWEFCKRVALDFPANSKLLWERCDDWLGFEMYWLVLFLCLDFRLVPGI